MRLPIRDGGHHALLSGGAMALKGMLLQLRNESPFIWLWGWHVVNVTRRDRLTAEERTRLLLASIIVHLRRSGTEVSQASSILLVHNQNPQDSNIQPVVVVAYEEFDVISRTRRKRTEEQVQELLLSQYRYHFDARLLMNGGFSFKLVIDSYASSLWYFWTHLVLLLERLNL